MKKSHRKLAVLERKYVVGLLLSCLAVVSSSTAQETLDAEPATDAALVQPFVDETTCVIVKVDLSQIELPNLEGTIDSMPAEAKAAYAEFARSLTAGSQELRVLVDDQPLFVTIGIPVSKTRIPIRLFLRKTSDDRAEELVAFLRNGLQGEVFIWGDYVVATPMGTGSGEKSLPASSATSREAISAAFQAVAAYPAQVLIIPPAHVWRTVSELSPQLPPQLGGGSSRVLTEGLQWAAVGMDPAQLRGEVVVHAASAAAARDFAAHLPVMLRSAYDAAPFIQQQLPPELVPSLIAWLEPQVEGDRVNIRIDGREKTKGNLSLLASIAQTIDQRTRRHTNQQRFKEILLAIHNYYDTYKTFPPADKYRDERGKHQLSWRVHILPFIGEEQLYREFRLDEPWDSPHNKPLLAKMPEAYARNSFGVPPQGKPKAGYTTFLAPVGEKTIFGGAKSTRFPQIQDGTSNTVAVLEVTPERAVPWTAPDDFQFDPQKPLSGVLKGADERWLAAFADGSVHQLRSDIPAETVLRLFQMNDGHPINVDKLR